MMNARKVTLLLAVFSLLLVFTVNAASRQDEDISVIDADEYKKISVGMTQDLADRIAGVGARIVLQYANELRPIGLVTVPASLQTLLDQVSPRIIIQYANANREDALVAIPGTLQTLLGQVPDRIILRYARTNRHLTLAYPAALINDTAPPQVSGLIASARGIGTVTIAWATDEFATSTVLYGTQPGVYSQTVSDPLYTKQHSITLTGLTPGTTPYYYRVRSTDRSGNTATSAEHSFNAQPTIYLPLIMRNNR
jgi:hypothetical protein